MPPAQVREDLEDAAPDGMWIDVMDVRPGMRLASYAEHGPIAITPAVFTVAAVSATLDPPGASARGWEVLVRMEGGEARSARGGDAVRRATVQPDEPTEVGAVVELDAWADSARYVFNGCGVWHDASGKPHSWLDVCQRGQVHVVVPGMYAIEEAR